MSRILSGIQPTNEPTLGNYLGAMRRWVEDQNSGDETLFFIADLHALTVEHDPVVLRQRTLDLATTLLAIGIDPKITTLFVQSHVPANSQLSWLLECTARFGELRRMTQFKDRGGESEGARAAIFTYPCLMAADILLYDIDEVPVGEDQRQHLELTRDIAIRFNGAYGETFVVPKATLPKTGARIKDLQQPEKKMSKTANPGGSILLTEDLASVERKIKRAVTDTEGAVAYDPVNRPGVSNLLEILAASTGGSPTTLADNYSQYGPLKADTAAAVVEMLRPIQQRYAELSADPSFAHAVLEQGSTKAKQIANPTLRRAQENIGLLLGN